MMKCFYDNKIHYSGGRYRENLYISFNYSLCYVCNRIHNSYNSYCCESCQNYSKNHSNYGNLWRVDYYCIYCYKHVLKDNRYYSMCHHCINPIKNKYMNVNVL